jgi:2-oxoglutarate dehydrogenase E2 component (dihydrolipoamide succinyltransferase)
MHKIEKRPVVIDDEVVIRPMMYVALSYDHRIVDGREAVPVAMWLRSVPPSWV